MEEVLSSDAIRQLISVYCFAPPSKCEQLAREQPELFQGELLDCLNDARALLQSTSSAYDESDRLFSSLMRQLDLPGEARAQQHQEGDGVGTSCDEESASSGQLVCQKEFTAALQKLLRDGASVPPPMLNERRVATTQSGSSSWLCSDEPLTLAILSFLPAETLFTNCENTCSVWRSWLCDGPCANSFWIGVVQREYPDQLMTLLSAVPSTSNDGDTSTLAPADPLNQDWRVVAMIAVCNADGTTDEILDVLADAHDVDDQG